MTSRAGDLHPDSRIDRHDQRVVDVEQPLLARLQVLSGIMLLSNARSPWSGYSYDQIPLVCR